MPVDPRVKQAHEQTSGFHQPRVCFEICDQSVVSKGIPISRADSLLRRVSLSRIAWATSYPVRVFYHVNKTTLVDDLNGRFLGPAARQHRQILFCDAHEALGA
jgi:hypothetical protein